VTRGEIEAYAAERGFAWREDASNSKCDYARNRLRLRWLPGLMEDFNPQLLRAIGDLAEAQRRDSEWIAGLVEKEAAARFFPEAGGFRIRLEGWDLLPEALARRLARWGLRASGGARDVSRVHLERMLKFLRSSRTGSHIELPGNLRLVRERDGFWLGAESLFPRPGEK
jgi:tRNA(Ile)-lysidine synthase